MNGCRRINECIFLSNELVLLGRLNGCLSIALSGFSVNVPEHEATPWSSPWLVEVKSHITPCPQALID